MAFEQSCSDSFSGDIWAMGSIPKIALSTIIMPDSESVQSRTMEEIIEGARSVFEKEKVSIVGVIYWEVN